MTPSVDLKFLEVLRMSKPIRVQQRKGVQGIEKAIALKAAQDYCKGNGLSLNKLGEQLLFITDEAAIFAAPRKTESTGLNSDLESQPIPVLYIVWKNGQIDFQQTEHTKKVLA